MEKEEKDENAVERGRLARQRGVIFEKKVRQHFRDLGYIVTRFSDNIDLESKEIVTAKFNPFRRGTTGFPDFVVFNQTTPAFFVECKVNDKLSKLERLKMEFLESKGFRAYVASNDNGTTNFRRVATGSP